MFLIDGPERYSAPPVETWMMPSEPASAKPCRAAFSVWELDTLMAGNAKAPAFAASSISAYFSGVAIGHGGHSSGSGRPGPNPSRYRRVTEYTDHDNRSGARRVHQA